MSEVLAHPHVALAPLSASKPGLTLRNRIAVAPMTRVSAARDGRATEAMHRYYQAFAEGGFGLVITEGTYVDRAHSQGYTNQPGLATDAHTAAWRPIVEAVHRGGAKFFAQLMHAGALVQGNEYRAEPVGPSAILPKGEQMPAYGGSGLYHVPRAMNEDDFRAITEAFCSAALRARDAGFDGVELHGANGYLFDQFLTTYTNLRTDDYGGGVENRIRFTAEVLRAVVEAVEPGFVVGVRLSEAKVNDKHYAWPGGGDDARIIGRALRDAGASYLHFAGGGPDFHFPTKLHQGGSLTQILREVAQVPVIANGSMGHLPNAERVLEEGHADVVALGRSALANPDWPSRLARGIPFEPYDFRIIQPSASLANAAAWREAQKLQANSVSVVNMNTGIEVPSTLRDGIVP
ncbi:tRNA-dihydrouridine synthase [Pendulispora albinea]|uniref:NADH:flavin oxidoreductase n=1 Tax=Pendulispora albinea TaxID=2741071 RepID=A0ABZ2LSU3_9BACT